MISYLTMRVSRMLEPGHEAILVDILDGASAVTRVIQWLFLVSRHAAYAADIFFLFRIIVSKLLYAAGHPFRFTQG